MKTNSTYNPDVLTCLANLSNDEVFTPPNIASDMLDQLPTAIWSDPNAKFLDPVTKTGVFLREIGKRLMEGLKEKIPDLQERINHIYSNQLYGLAITELTALLSRRSVYCSKYANGKYSIVTNFLNPQGNIIYERIEHEWLNGNCKFCGANQSEYDRSQELETHAYKFIHTVNFEEVFKMKFDVIIGNPPYQLSDSGNGASAMPLYHYFVQQAKKLQPSHLVMIIPSRWFAGGKGLDSFRSEMLADRHIKTIHDFLDAKECFPGVEIKGGVNYFHWDKQYSGDATIYTHEKNNISSVMKRPLLRKGDDIFVRYNDAISILNKISSHNQPSFNEIVSSRKPFGLATNFTERYPFFKQRVYHS